MGWSLRMLGAPPMSETEGRVLGRKKVGLSNLNSVVLVKKGTEMTA